MTDTDPRRPVVSAPPPARRVPRRKRVIADWRTDPWDDPDTLVEVELDRTRRGSVLGRLFGFGFFVVLAVMILVAGSAGYWVLRQVNPPGDAGAKVNFTINSTDTIDTLAERMQQQGIITNAKVFKEYVKRKGGYTPLVGYYTVRPKDTMGNILAVLRTPPALTFETVTFPEGFTLLDMGKRLANKVPRLNEAKFATAATDGQVRSKFSPEGVSSLEGLIFPDTYQVAGNEDETSVLKRMVDRMERVAVKQGIEKPPFAGFTPYAILTIASIIEKEAKVDADRGKIARVIYNRLALGMSLEIDATLRYGADPNTPFAQLLDVDTPYNSYKHPGLPPTPIANPGAKSISAALNPTPDPALTTCGEKAKECHYLYYVLKDKDTHVFATNVEDHQKNVEAARAAGLLG
jgi:UPF0755 protein